MPIRASAQRAMSSSGSAASTDSEVLEHRALRARQAVAALRDRLALLESSTGKELASLRAQLEAQQPKRIEAAVRRPASSASSSSAWNRAGTFEVLSRR